MPDCIAHQQLAKGLPPVHREQWLPSGQDPSEIIHADTEKPVATSKWTSAATAQPVDAGAGGDDSQEAEKKPAALPSPAPAPGGNGEKGGNGPPDGQGNGDGGTGPGGDAPGGQGPTVAGTQPHAHEVFPKIPEFIPSKGASALASACLSTVGSWPEFDERLLAFSPGKPARLAQNSIWQDQAALQLDIKENCFAS